MYTRRILDPIITVATRVEKLTSASGIDTLNAHRSNDVNLIQWVALANLVTVDTLFSEVEIRTRGFAPETELDVAVCRHDCCGGSTCKGDGGGEDGGEVHFCG
jgi:hypothetical protein